MRTTIRLDEKLLREAKRYAADAGITLNAVIEESSRDDSLERNWARSHAASRASTRPGAGDSVPALISTTPHLSWTRWTARADRPEVNVPVHAHRSDGPDQLK